MGHSKYDSLKLENQLCFPLYAASREIIKQYSPYLKDLDLTYTQYITMMVVWEEKIINVKELGKRLFLDSGTLTPVLKSLENKGYVHRYRSPKDERVLLVEITETGDLLRERALIVPQKAAGCSKLSPEEGLLLYQLLYKMLGQLPEREEKK